MTRLTRLEVTLQLDDGMDPRPTAGRGDYRPTQATLRYLLRTTGQGWTRYARVTGPRLRKDGSDATTPEAGESFGQFASAPPPWLDALLDEYEPGVRDGRPVMSAPVLWEGECANCGRRVDELTVVWSDTGCPWEWPYCGVPCMEAHAEAASDAEATS